MLPRWTRLRGLLGIDSTPVSHLERGVALLGGFIGIATMLVISGAFIEGIGSALLVASMGSSAVLLFALPHAAVSQPWPVTGGHLVSALVGVTCARLVPDFMWAAALAVGLAIGAMHYLRCIHPSGGATALAAVAGGESVHALGYGFVLTPVLLNALVLLVVAFLYNYPLRWRRYPAVMAVKAAPSAPNAATTEPVIHHSDLVYALSQIDSFIDVGEDDLLRIYDLVMLRHRQEQAAYTPVKLGCHYSNGQYGDAWEVRQVVDESAHDGGSIIYKIVAGARRRRSGVATREAFAHWAAYEVRLVENVWQRVEEEE